MEETQIMESISLRAAALTYYTLMAIVPTLAVAFGIIQYIGINLPLDEVLIKNFPEHREVFTHLTQFAETMLEQTRGGLIAITGGLVFAWAIFFLLWNIEDAFNEILEVTVGRTLWHKLLTYSGITIIAPFAVILTNNVIFFLFSPFIFLRLVALLVTIFLFTFLYKVMPKASVPWPKAFFAATLSAIAFQSIQWLYWKFQLGASTYGVIYGSFAAIPLFLVWVNISWMIILLGAKLSYETHAKYTGNNSL